MAPRSSTSQTSKRSHHSAAAQVASSPTKSTPKPRICQRCDGHPLIKDCEVHKAKPCHSKKSVTKLAVAQAMNNIGLPPPQIVKASPTDNFTTGMPGDPPVPQGSTGPHPSDVFNDSNLDPTLRTPQHVSVPNSDPFVETPQRKSKPPSVRFPIAGIGAPTPTSQFLRFDNDEEEDIHSYLPLTSPGIPGLTLSLQPSYTPGSSLGHIRPTMANPFHGMVFSAMRGTQPHGPISATSLSVVIMGNPSKKKKKSATSTATTQPTATPAISTSPATSSSASIQPPEPNMSSSGSFTTPSEFLQLMAMVNSGLVTFIEGFLKEVSGTPEGNLFKAFWDRANYEGIMSPGDNTVMFNEGVEEGYRDGKEDRYKEGWEAGMAKAKEDINSIIDVAFHRGHDIGCTTDKIYVNIEVQMLVEQLNVEMGGWLFFMGQHGNATSTNTFFHYASNKLREEASDATNGLINRFGDIIDGLILLNKKEAVNLNKQYADSERRRQRAVQDAQLARQADLMFGLLQKLQSGALESHEIPNLNTMRPSSNCT
ncbi:hypothetical protein DXG01_001998 [Tephrocybe rancida]|nr:hypothetical protein DXG01_001998 [Tephrocybe rancida]